MGKSEIIQIEISGDIAVVQFRQDSITEASGVEEITTVLRNYIASAGTKKLLVDFTNVRFFSSQVLGLLVDLWRRLKTGGGVMAICGVNPQLGRIFRITNLDRIFVFYPDRPGAMAALVAGHP